MTPLNAVSSIIEFLESDAERLSFRLVNVRLYPPRVARALARAVQKLLYASLAVAAASPAAALASPLLASALAAAAPALLALAWLAPRAWRWIVGAGVDRELPGILAYLLPYSSSARYIADVLASIPQGYFRWFRYESERLRYLQDLGLDPVSALRTLAETTPSRKLRRVLTDYMHVQELGAPRSQATLRLLEAAVEEVRASWRGYSDLGRGLVEAVTAAVITAVALAPMALLAGSVDGRLAALPLVASPLAAIVLLLARPEIGDYRPGLAPAATAVLSSIAAAGLGLMLGLQYSALLLIAATIALEYVALRHSRLEEEAYRRLREAVDEARYGKLLDEVLLGAERLAGSIVPALLEAVRVAGKLGVSDAVMNIYRVVEEARSTRLQMRGGALLLAAIAVAAPAIAVYTLRAIASMSTGGSFIAGDPESLNLAASLVAALSPLAPLPASVLHRGWTPSLVPSLAALAASHAALTAT